MPPARSRKESVLKAPPIRPDGLQLDDKRRFQRRFWTLERFAWLAFGATVVAALAGLTGSGGYFSRQSVAAGSATADLPRISRWDASDWISVSLPGGTTSHSILLGEDFGRYFLIERTQPPPSSSLATSGGFVLEFAGRGEGPKEVLMSIRPLSPGYAKFDMAVDGERAAASILVLP